MNEGSGRCLNAAQFAREEERRRPFPLSAPAVESEASGDAWPNASFSKDPKANAQRASRRTSGFATKEGEARVVPHASPSFTEFERNSNNWLCLHGKGVYPVGRGLFAER